MNRLALAVLILAAAPAAAQPAAKPKAKRERVPLKRIKKPLQKEIVRVTKDPTVRCLLSPRTVRTRSAVYRYFLNHLPLASRMLKALGKATYDIKDLPQARFSIDDRAGASAKCDRALEEEGYLVVLAKGKLEVPILPKILGSGVIMVRYVPAKLKLEVPPKKPGQKPTYKEVPGLRCQAQVDFRVDNSLLHALGKTFQRVLVGVLTRKLDQLVSSAIYLAEQVHLDPFKLYKRLKKAKLSKDDLAAFRKQFLLA